MRAIRSLLVIVDLHQPHHPALRRAAFLARGLDAELHLLAFDPHTTCGEHLAALAEELRSQGHTVSTRQESTACSHQAIIAAQQTEGCGLVIKEHQPDNPLKKTLLTPGDWKLLRFCPCPVLLVKTDRAWARGAVLAAVDVGSADADHLALHGRIVEYGHDLARLTEGHLHVLTAHPAAILAAADPTEELAEAIEARYRSACEAFQREYGLPDGRLHVREGPADVLIPQVAHELEAVICVLGSVARAGVSGVLMGNTAEVVLDALQSDVLVLKPDDIVARLEAHTGRD